MKRILLFAGIGFIVLTIIVVVVTLVSRRSSQPTTTAPKTTAKGPVKLTIWRYQDDEATFKSIIEQFIAANPDVTVEYVKKDLASYELDATNALASGKGPDIWSVPNDWLPRHQDKLVAAADGLLRRDKNDKRSNQDVVSESFVPIVSSDVTLANKLYGLAYTVDTLALYVNTEQTRKVINERLTKNETLEDFVLSHRIQNWNDFVKFVKLMSARDKDTVLRSAVAVGTGSNVEVAPELMAVIMMQNRTQMISNDGLTATFNLPAKKSTGATFNPGKEAVDFYTSFANPAKETFSWTPQSGNAQQAFLDGKTMMVFGFSDFEQTIKQLKPSLQYRVLPLPQIAGASKAVDIASYPVETVTNNAESPETAWAFLKFAALGGLQDYLATSQRPSPLKNPFTPKTVQDRIDFGSPFKFQQQTAVKWDRGKDPERVEAAFRRMADDIIARGVNSQQAIDSAAEQVTKILRDAAGFEPQPVEE